MKKLIALFLAFTMVFGLYACSDSSSNGDDNGTTDTGTEETDTTKDNGGGSSAGGRKLTISLETQTPKVEEQRQQYFNEKLYAAFLDDDITIEVFADVQSLQVQVAGGSGPDIFHLNGPTDATEYAKADRIVDLTDYAQQYGWEDMFYEWAWGTSFYDGKLYSLPNSFEGMVIYYNMTVFEENGWDKPKNADELVDIFLDAQSKGIIPMAFGNAAYQGAVDWLYSTFLSAYAGPETIKAALEGDTTWDNPLIVESMQLLVDWWQEGYIGEKRSQAITGDDMVALFADGSAAMMINGTWAATDLNGVYSDCDWDAELVPELRDGVGEILPLATGGCFSINATSSDVDFAAEVLNWIYTDYLDDHLQSVIDVDFQPYPLKAITADSLSEMDPKMVDLYDIMFEGMETGNVGYCSWTFYPSDARVYTNENTDALFLGSLTVEEYLAEVQGYVDNALETGTAPTLP